MKINARNCARMSEQTATFESRLEELVQFGYDHGNNIEAECNECYGSGYCSLCGGSGEW